MLRNYQLVCCLPARMVAGCGAFAGEARQAHQGCPKVRVIQCAQYISEMIGPGPAAHR